MVRYVAVPGEPSVPRPLKVRSDFLHICGPFTQRFPRSDYMEQDLLKNTFFMPLRPLTCLD